VLVPEMLGRYRVQAGSMIGLTNLSVDESLEPRAMLRVLGLDGAERQIGDRATSSSLRAAVGLLRLFVRVTHRRPAPELHAP